MLPHDGEVMGDVERREEREMWNEEGGKWKVERGMRREEREMWNEEGGKRVER